MNTTYTEDVMDEIYFALSNQKRRGIIHDLSLMPSTVNSLATRHSLTLPAIHKHIRMLESAGLIMRRKSGRTNFVSLKNDSLMLAQNWLMQYHLDWSSPNASLDNYIAGMKE